MAMAAARAPFSHFRAVCTAARPVGTRRAFSASYTPLRIAQRGAPAKSRYCPQPAAQWRQALSVTAPIRAMSDSVDDTSAFVAAELRSAPVVVFAKSSCPFCKQIQVMFKTMKLKEPPRTIDLQGMPDMVAIQDVLEDVTGARSVPRVFIGGEFVGGCDDTMDKYYDGSLETKLKEAGAL